MRLRCLKEKDAYGMLEWMHDSEIQNNFRFNAQDMDETDVLQFIKEAANISVYNKNIHYAITDAKDEYLGTISLKNIDLESKNAEFAISLRKKAQGMGIGFVATQEILRFAFDSLGLEKVYLNVLSENRKAIHLYEKCGFVFEGEFRKHIFLKGEFKALKWYSILKEEYVLQYRGGVNRIHIKLLPVLLGMLPNNKFKMEVA